MDTATDWLLSLDTETISEAEQMQDELERLQAQLELAHSREDLDEYPRTSAEAAGHQIRCERLCARIAVLKEELKGQR